MTTSGSHFGCFRTVLLRARFKCFFFIYLNDFGVFVAKYHFKTVNIYRGSLGCFLNFTINKPFPEISNTKILRGMSAQPIILTQLPYFDTLNSFHSLLVCLLNRLK